MCAVVVQMICLYVFSFLHKSDDVWRKDFTAAYYALRLDFFRRPLGDLLLHYPALLKALSFATRT